MAIEDYTNELKWLQEHGEPDLLLSPDGRDAYIGLVVDCLYVLRAQRNKIAEMPDLLEPGGFPSAQLTKTELVWNRYELHRKCDEMIEYLDEYEDMVTAAFNRAQNEDQAG